MACIPDCQFKAVGFNVRKTGWFERRFDGCGSMVIFDKHKVAAEPAGRPVSGNSGIEVRQYRTDGRKYYGRRRRGRLQWWRNPHSIQIIISASVFRSNMKSLPPAEGGVGMDTRRLHFSDRHNVVETYQNRDHGMVFTGYFKWAGISLAGIHAGGIFRRHNSAFRRTIDTGNAITQILSAGARIWPVPPATGRGYGRSWGV